MILLGVMGNPIEHSRSPEIHLEFARQHQLQIEYEKLLVPENGFKDVAKTFLERGSLGFNVTLPNKGDACQYVDQLSEDAKASQSVNTVVVEASGRLTGHNTDGLGLSRDMQSNLSWRIEGKSVLILGAGGAVRGVMASILKMKPGQLHVYNRTPEKAIQLEKQHPSTCLKAVPMENLLEGYDFVISGTSAGLLGGEIGLPSKIIGANTLCYDMIYAQTKTPFQTWCDKHNCQESVDGLGMLIEQAAQAFTLWTDCEVNTEAVIQKLRYTI